MNRSRVLGLVGILSLATLATPASFREFNRVYLAPIQGPLLFESSRYISGSDTEGTDEALRQNDLGVTMAAVGRGRCLMTVQLTRAD